MYVKIHCYDCDISALRHRLFVPLLIGGRYEFRRKMRTFYFGRLFFINTYAIR